MRILISLRGRFLTEDDVIVLSATKIHFSIDTYTSYNSPVFSVYRSLRVVNILKG